VKLQAAIHKVNEAAQRDADGVTAHLSAEFGTTSSAMADEGERCECSAGDLMVAYTLAGNSKEQVSADALFDLRHDMAWSQIAAGMGYRLEDTVAAVRSESQVIVSGNHLDGKVATIHGPGATAGLGVTSSAQVGANTDGVRIGGDGAVRAGASMVPPVIGRP